MKHCLLLLTTLCLFSSSLFAQKKIKKEWVSTLHYLCEKTHSPSAYEALRIARKMKIRRPGEILDTASKNTVYFIPVTLADTVYPLLRHYILNKSVSAWQFQRAVYVKNFGEPTSSFYKALVLFHEIQHTQAVGVCMTPTQHAKEELRVYVMQNEILTLLGGSAYKNFLEEEIAYVTFYMNHAGVNDLDLLPRHLSVKPELDSIFGKTLSVTERNARHSTFWIHVIMKYLERTNTGLNVQMNQTYFLQTLYQKDIY